MGQQPDDRDQCDQSDDSQNRQGYDLFLPLLPLPDLFPIGCGPLAGVAVLSHARLPPSASVVLLLYQERFQPWQRIVPPLDVSPPPNR